MRTKIRLFFETTNHFGTYLHIGRLIIIEASYFFGIIFVIYSCLYHRVVLSKAKDLGGCMRVRGCVTQNPLHFVLNDISIDKPTRLKSINPYFFDVILQSKSLFFVYLRIRSIT